MLLAVDAFVHGSLSFLIGVIVTLAVIRYIRPVRKAVAKWLDR